MKIKILTDYSNFNLEIQANDFIEGLGNKFVSILFSTCGEGDSDSSETVYSVCIIYQN